MSVRRRLPFWIIFLVALAVFLASALALGVQAGAIR